MSDMHALAQRMDDLAEHFEQVSNQLADDIAHMQGLGSEVDDALSQHAAVYDEPTKTGDETRGQVQGCGSDISEATQQVSSAKDSVDQIAARLRTVASEIRDHAARIEAAGQS